MNRRNFSRIIYQTPATLSQGKKVWPCQLVDLSLKGALVSDLTDFDSNNVMPFLLHFALAESGQQIEMTVTVSYSKDQHVGFKTRLIDIDSATHLRRMIELNVGDDKLLHRELDKLTAPDVVGH